jgi:hypothetical protein
MGRNRTIVICYRIVFAAYGLAAVGVQLGDVLRHSGAVINFFSFFTIQSNVLAAGVFIYGAIAARRAVRPGYDVLRGAATTYMSITGVVYAVLLSHLEAAADSSLGWVNFALHKVLPLLVFLDWLFVPPARRLRFGRALTWLIYPIAYGTYTLIRGASAHWYPYPFLNADQHSAGRLALNCVAVLVASSAFIWIVVFLGNLMRPDRTVARAHA